MIRYCTSLAVVVLLFIAAKATGLALHVIHFRNWLTNTRYIRWWTETPLIVQHQPPYRRPWVCWRAINLRSPGSYSEPFATYLIAEEFAKSTCGPVHGVHYAIQSV